MATIVTIEQQQTIKPISTNQRNGFFTQIATEVEENDFRDLVGESLKQDLQTNPNTESNEKLLNGDTLEDCQGNTIKHKGLRFVLAYFTYALYVGRSAYNDTYSGMTIKSRDDSRDVSEGAIKRLQNEARQIAEKEWLLIKSYLEQNADKYPLYNVGRVRPKTHLPKFRGMRRTSR